MTKVPCYLIFGPQGSGKSTQAEMLAAKLGLPFFDSGKQLREMVTKGGETAEQVGKIMQTGQLVPNEILRQIFDEYIHSHDCSRGLVMDGFPRNMTQTQLFSDLARDYSWEVTAFYVAISDETAKERLSKRYQVIDGKKVFRQDDKPAIVAKRLAVFKQETMPVIKWLKEHYDVHEIDGEPPREKVFENIIEKING